MEVMEDGNLMDKVHILIQRDMEYYRSKQTILQEIICPGIVGGRLDFPRFVSFASMKLVIWWEDEYLAAFRKGSGFLKKTVDFSNDNDESSGGCGGIVKASDPTKFVNSVTKSADDLLAHLHILTQEALDHADLTVLTGTIGAVSLIKNCLWFYIHSMDSSKQSSQINLLQTSYKKYQEMEEALAERLLDLHCRLLSLYILQDADCLDWENEKPFFESERGSYVIQMWWLYMQGTKVDLWNSVPPKMAQRVFVGMLNESLTILTVRYIQAIPSKARSPLLIVDISNLLLCVAQLLSSVCDNAEEYIGLALNSRSKILRDIHTKCQELLHCLLLRGAPLDCLSKLFRKGIEKVELFKCKNFGPMPWILFALPDIFKQINIKNVVKFSDLPEDISITLELAVLLNQPQPFWNSLLKVVLGMKKCKVLKLITDLCLNFGQEKICCIETSQTKKCDGFLCSANGSCKSVKENSAFYTTTHYYNLFFSCTCVILSIGNDEELTDYFKKISKQSNWARCLDRRSVWNQIHPAWFEAILHLVDPLLPTIISTTINAVETGASTYQSMSVVLACFSFLWDCANNTIIRVTNIIQDLLPTDVVPLGHSVLLQTLIAALYSKLYKMSQGEVAKKQVKVVDDETSAPIKKENAMASMLAEALCSIDEDNKHTDQIEEFLQQAKDSEEKYENLQCGSARLEVSEENCEVLVSELLDSPYGRFSLDILYKFLKNNNEWLFQNLGTSMIKEEFIPNKAVCVEKNLLYTMFHIGYRPFDQILSGQWNLDWMCFLNLPMSLTPEKVSLHINNRWEFRDNNSSSLSNHDIQIINKVSALLKTTL